MSSVSSVRIWGFKRFETAEIELAAAVVLVGPNDSGKTTALQALGLWQIAVRKLHERHGTRPFPRKRPGVTVNRLELSTAPVPSAAQLWRDLRTRTPGNVVFTIEVAGTHDGVPWVFAVEYDYVNPESVQVRPRRHDDDPGHIPDGAIATQIAYLPPMSGVTIEEPLWAPARTRALIGQGQTAQVLRNVCFELSEDDQAWNAVSERLRAMFGVEIEKPREVEGQLVMSYAGPSGRALDLSTAGRGMQQTLLLLAFLFVNRGAVVLLDEPDAHLEVLRQREVYNAVVDVATETGGQVVAASHSEVVLGEAILRDRVFAFVGGAPQELGKGDLAQLNKALREIPAADYYLARTRSWALYLEGETDLAILRAIAKKLDHPSIGALAAPFVQYVGNQPQRAKAHFHGLRFAQPEMRGFALFDRLDGGLQESPPLRAHMWIRREIENYLTSRAALLDWAASQDEPLFAEPWISAMERAIEAVDRSLKTLGRTGIGDPDEKASEGILPPIFKLVFDELDRRNEMAKRSFHRLASFLPIGEIDPEIISVLDAIAEVAE